LKRKCLAFGIILLFVAIALSPTYTAKVSAPLINDNKSPKESPITKVTHASNENESFFNFAIIWGTFEEKIDYAPLFSLIVRNPYPWYNRTMYVIGYQNWVPQWTFKKSYQVECGFLHIGIVGFHRLAVIAYGNIAAF
jgi:hypothetical protein